MIYFLCFILGALCIISLDGWLTKSYRGYQLNILQKVLDRWDEIPTKCHDKYWSPGIDEELVDILQRVAKGEELGQGTRYLKPALIMTEGRLVEEIPYEL